MITLAALQQLDPIRFEAPAILKKLASASRCLAELKAWSRRSHTKAS
jgi:hypothetical protein